MSAKRMILISFLAALTAIGAFLKIPVSYTHLDVYKRQALNTEIYLTFFLLSTVMQKKEKCKKHLKITFLSK